LSLPVEQVAAKVNRLKAKFSARDARMADILSVRNGDADRVSPGLFPEAWPKPIVANFCDVAAHDLAELIAPLPSFNCASASMVSEKARQFADKRTKIAHYYVLHSDLGTQMYRGADQFCTYGFQPFVVEPDFDAMCPRIRVEESLGAYPEFDRWGECVSLTRVFAKPLGDLIVEYPQFAGVLESNEIRDRNALIQVVKYVDKDQYLMFVPSRNNLVLNKADNPLGECPAVIALRPSIDNEMRGQFDDVLWVQIARAKMALLGMEAAQKSVQAPLALPDDVQEITFGSDAVLRSRSPEKIRRVGVELPQGAFAESQMHWRTRCVSARGTPKVAQGNIDSVSVITGRGMQELTRRASTPRSRPAGLFAGDTLRQVLELCFLMDEKLWPDQQKTCAATCRARRTRVSYVPRVDIAGDHSIDVSYGFAPAWTRTARSCSCSSSAGTS
jgi:hypothetical protein